MAASREGLALSGFVVDAITGIGLDRPDSLLRRGLGRVGFGRRNRLAVDRGEDEAVLAWSMRRGRVRDAASVGERRKGSVSDRPDVDRRGPDRGPVQAIEHAGSGLDHVREYDAKKAEVLARI